MEDSAVVTMDLSTWQSLRARDPRRLVLGSAQWALPYGVANCTGPPDAVELETMLGRARDAGIRSIETAGAYGDSETRIGQILRAVPSGEGWRLATHLAPDVHETGLGIGETLERVAASLLKSRIALGQDTLPIVVLHRSEHRHACGGKLWRMLLAERDAGRIGSLGISAASPEEAWAALDDPDVEVLQVAASLLDLRLLRQDFFPRARELGRNVYVHSIFLQGVAHLAPEALPSFLGGLLEPISRIHSTAGSLGVTPRALYLAFAREYLPGVHPIVGCETATQLDQLLADWESSDIDVAKLSPLVDSLPTQEAHLVDPAQWPSREDATETPGNQTGRAGVATIPS
jgi:aryl-alcohol dehydrogenase-like predicted oxidoreductase